MLSGIDLVFALINFTIVIGILTYAFIRYLRPAIKHELYLEREHVTHLKTHRLELVERQEQVDKEIAQQSLEAEELKKKVALWRELDYKESQKKAEALQYHIQELEKKREKQSENHNLQLMSRRISGRVTAQVIQDLETYFSGQGNQERYMDDLLNTLEKNEKSV